MSKKLFTALLFLALAPLLRAAPELTPEQFKAVAAKAQDMDHTTIGLAYEERFAEAIKDSLREAIKACAGRAKPPFEIDLVFVISADGKVEHIFTDPSQPIAASVAGRLEREKVPPPPRADWMHLVNINIHN